MSLFVRTYRGARSGHKQCLADAAPAARDDRRHERLKTCHENMSWKHAETSNYRNSVSFSKWHRSILHNRYAVRSVQSGQRTFSRFVAQVFTDAFLSSNTWFLSISCQSVQTKSAKFKPPNMCATMKQCNCWIWIIKTMRILKIISKNIET